MSRENPRQLIRSFPLSAQFATGPITQDKLVPATFGRVRTNFCQTWREDALPSTLDWGKTISYFFPESLACISAAYLQIQLPVPPTKRFQHFIALRNSVFSVMGLRFPNAMSKTNFETT